VAIPRSNITATIHLLLDSSRLGNDMLELMYA
jgi:hypothetical protein